MTIETTSIKAVALGNGATTVWPYTFLIPAEADLVLTLVDVASGNPTVISPVNYTVTGIDSALGGTVTYPLSGSPLTSASYIVIERALPLKQETDLLNQGAVYPQVIEDALDYLTMVTQQLQDQINRAIVFSVADTVETDLPTATARANKFLGFNSNGDPVAVDGLTPGTTVSAAMIPVVTAPTTAAALTALGLPGALLDLLIPAGAMWAYAGTTAPTGFVLGFGQPCTSTYPTLRALLVAAGSPFGTNGVDPLFPDGRSRSMVGKSNMGGVDNGLWTGGTVLGAVAGVQSVTLDRTMIPTGITVANAAQSIIVNPANNPSLFCPTDITGIQSQGTSLSAGTSNVAFHATNAWGQTATFQANNSISATSNNTGGLSHENRHPGLIVNILVKAH